MRMRTIRCDKGHTFRFPLYQVVGWCQVQGCGSDRLEWIRGRQRKTRDVYDIQGDYGYGHGWETLCAEETYREARAQVRCYRENEPGVPFRIKLTRERISE
jgi:hypothetical protein